MPMLPPLRLTGATILRDNELRQRSVAIARGRISKGPLPAVDMQGYLILPGIIDLLFHAPAGADPGSRIRKASAISSRAGITTAWVTPRWGWQGGPDDPAQSHALLSALACRLGDELRPALRIESHSTLATEELVRLARDVALELAWFDSDFQPLFDASRNDEGAFARRSRALGIAPDMLRMMLDQAAQHLRDVPRHLCRLAETFDEIRARYGSIGDTGGAMRETHSMIGASLAACPAAHSAAAAARAMGDPVLLSAADPDALHDMLRGGLGDAIVSGGAPQRMVSLALSLAGPDLSALPRIWSLMSSRPAEIMGLADRGTLEHGSRADMIIVAQDTGVVEGTIQAGKLTWLTGPARHRFQHILGNDPGSVAQSRIAAE